MLRDECHATDLGRYIATVTTFCTLYGTDPHKLAKFYSYIEGYYPDKARRGTITPRALKIVNDIIAETIKQTGMGLMQEIQ